MSRLFERVSETALALALAVLVVVLAATTERFATSGNLLTIAQQSAKVLIVAVPFAMLLIARYVDFSVGSTVALCCVLGGKLMDDGGMAWPLACALTLAAAAVIGLLNGWATAYLGFSAIVVTLGMLGLLRGLAFVLAGDRYSSGFPHGFAYLGQGRISGIDLPIPVLLAALMFGVAWVFYYRTRRGRHAQAIGAGPTASYLSGIPSQRIVLALYVLCALAAGLVGLMTASELGSGTATVGDGFELTVLTAVLLGGVAFAGGHGTLVGVLLGTVFVYVLANGFTQWGLGTDEVRLANGGVLIVAAGLQAVAGRVAARGTGEATAGLARRRRRPGRAAVREAA